MWRKLAVGLTAVSLIVATMPTDVMARAGGGGGGGGSRGGGGGFGGGGGRSFGGGGFSGVRSGGFSGGGLRTFSTQGGMNRGVPNGAIMNRGVGTQTFINRSAINTNRNISSAALAGRHVSANGRWAWIGGHRHHGRHIHGFIPGIGYAWYWYYDDCYVLTDYGWINMCGYDNDY